MVARATQTFLWKNRCACLASSTKATVKVVLRMGEEIKMKDANAECRGELESYNDLTMEITLVPFEIKICLNFYHLKTIK